MSVFRWIGAHSNRVAGVARAFFYMGVILTWWHWTAEQMGAVMAFVESVLFMLVETNTESKVRMGERIEEEKAKVEIKAEQKADAKVAAFMTGTGSGVNRL